MGFGKVIVETVRDGKAVLQGKGLEYAKSIRDSLPQSTGLFNTLNLERNPDGSVNWKLYSKPFVEAVQQAGAGVYVIPDDPDGLVSLGWVAVVDAMGNLILMPPMWRHDP